MKPNVDKLSAGPVNHGVCAFGTTILLVMLGQPCLYAKTTDTRTGLQIMAEVYNRHQQYPYIYEEQSVVMVDRNGNRDTRKARRYSRVEEDGTVKFLFLFDYPEEVRGVAVLARRDPDGNTVKSIYLPAFGEQLIESSGTGSNGNFLGTDFSIEDLTGEILADYRYIRRQDRKIEDSRYFIIDVYRATDDIQTAELLRRHYIREDNFYITRTQYFDRQGRVYKQQSRHDLRPVDGIMWRANMILMENYKEQHTSLVKIDRRIFSYDYVPEEMFSADWLFANYPYLNPVEDNGKNDGNSDAAAADNEQQTTPVSAEAPPGP